MKLKDILSISGFSGLFQFISQGRNGIIVEGLEDKKRMNAYAHYKVSTLSDIAIFAESGEIKLKVILKKIAEKHANGQSIPSKSSDKELKDYMAEILPDYDQERVYASDIRKVVSWYNILQKLDMLAILDEPDEEESAENSDDKTGEHAADKTKEKTDNKPEKKKEVKAEKASVKNKSTQARVRTKK